VPDNSPKTAAGRQLYDGHVAQKVFCGLPDEMLLDFILAIEAEAASPDSARLRAALEQLDHEWEKWDDRDDLIPPERSFKVPPPVKRFIEQARAALTPEAKE
jgi:hypothetical protein